MEPKLILPILGGLLLYFAIKMAVRMPGKSLNRKFVRLGNFNGLNKEEFIKRVGPFQAVSNLSEGMQLCQWYATGYRMSIVFDKDGNFVKIQSEISS
jgi:uncharacterized protein YodC (DUF2158 family)